MGNAQLKKFGDKKVQCWGINSLNFNLIIFKNYRLHLQLYITPFCHEKEKYYLRIPKSIR